MVKYTLRPAVESEDSQIRALIHLVGINPMGLDWRRFVVAVDDGGRVLSCGQLKPHGRDVLELASIATLPEFRGQGLARAVITALLKDAPRPLYLMCVAHNGPMYARFGFRRIGYEEMPRYFQRIKKLFDITSGLRKTEEDLWVMKLE